jgi:CHASE3 domain sensor protein
MKNKKILSNLILLLLALFILAFYVYTKTLSRSASIDKSPVTQSDISSQNTLEVNPEPNKAPVQEVQGLPAPIIKN